MPLIIIANVFLAALTVGLTAVLLGSAIWTPRRPQLPVRADATSASETHAREAGIGAPPVFAPQA